MNTDLIYKKYYLDKVYKNDFDELLRTDPTSTDNKKGKYVVVETTNPEPYGSETYVMGLKNEAGKMKVAQRENSAMLLEDNYETKYEGFDPDSEESYILMSMISLLGRQPIQKMFKCSHGRLLSGQTRHLILCFVLKSNSLKNREIVNSVLKPRESRQLK